MLPKFSIPYSPACAEGRQKLNRASPYSCCRQIVACNVGFGLLVMVAELLFRSWKEGKVNIRGNFGQSRKSGSFIKTAKACDLCDLCIERKIILNKIINSLFSLRLPQQVSNSTGRTVGYSSIRRASPHSIQPNGRGVFGI